ncbi:MAG TPA: efflux RND transporter periplasmic adaptor subunit [Deltaproteobacteria bacterium]|nr:efflux RND transporter periplasmic adaptor subunit [Deltaproteobacteria bacterium]HOI08373.1 efflux RND transporter periplasmic adaptor subunit [Deltaproteobacteria bacterium]
MSEKMNNVKVWPVEKRSVQPYLDSIGSLYPDEEVTVSSEADGMLRAVYVDEGTPVSRGTVLAKVDDTDYRLNVSTAEALVKQAEAGLLNLKVEHRRKEALYKEELVTLQQFDDISTRLAVETQELQRAQVALSLARQRLHKTTVCSPIQGIVKLKMVSAGDFVRTSMPVMTIVRINPLKLSFSVTEKDVGLLKVGQDIVFTVDTFPGREFKGTLKVIYPSLDERTRTLRAEALVENPTLELKPGFFARVKVYTSSPREAVVVPATSLLYEGTKVKAFLQEGDRARERSLRIGSKYGEMVEVLEGLTGGEKLIVVGQNNLADGMKIHVVR